MQNNQPLNKANLQKPLVNPSPAKPSPRELTEKYLQNLFSTLVEQPEKRKVTQKEALQAAKLFLDKENIHKFKNFKDVKDHVQSPEGKQKLTEKLTAIRKKNAQAEAMEDYAIKKFQLDQRNKKSAIASVLLGAKKKRDAKTKHLNELIHEQDIKQLKAREEGTQKIIAASLGPAPAPALAPIRPKTLADYTRDVQLIGELLNIKQQELDAINSKLAKLAEEKELFDKKYDDDLKHIDKAYDEIRELAKAGPIPPETIVDKIATLEKQRNEHQDQAAVHLNKGDDVAALKSKDECYKTEQHLSTYRQLHSVITGKSDMYRLDGTKTEDFNEADFIIRKDLDKVPVFHDGKHYLLTPSQAKNVENLTEEDKKNAEDDYLKHRPNIMNMKHLKHHDHQLQCQKHSEEVASSLVQQEVKQFEVDLLHQQKAHALEQCNRLTPTLHNPMSSRIPEASPDVAFNTMLNNMKNNPTQTELNSLQNFVQGVIDKKLDAAPLNAERLKDVQELREAQRQLQTLRQGQPIPVDVMTLLLKEHGQKLDWKVMHTPHVAALKVVAPKLDDPAPPPFSPSPFNTKP